MLTSHQLAKLLLSSPDQPVVIEDAERGYGIVMGRRKASVTIEANQVTSPYSGKPAIQLEIGGFQY